MKFKVEIKEVLIRTIEVEAASKSKAEAKVEKMWKNSEVVLDSDDFSYVEYTAYKED